MAMGGYSGDEAFVPLEQTLPRFCGVLRDPFVGPTSPQRRRNSQPCAKSGGRRVGLVIPELKGKFAGMAFRVPTATVSVVDFTVLLSRAATTEHINAAMKEYADGPMKGILAYSEKPLVSWRSGIQCGDTCGNGGPAFGGGIENNNQCTLNLTNSTVSANLCQGGAGASGMAGGIAAGAGISNDRGSLAILTDSILSLNECLSGPGGASANRGTAVGGGIADSGYSLFNVPDVSSLTANNCQIIGNLVQGGMAGSSAAGGDGLDGGLFAANGTVVLKAVLVNSNQSQGGPDSQGTTSGHLLASAAEGNRGGGGLRVWETAILRNRDWSFLILISRVSAACSVACGVLPAGLVQ
jgi:hypothetical protein